MGSCRGNPDPPRLPLPGYGDPEGYLVRGVAAVVLLPGCVREQSQRADNLALIALIAIVAARADVVTPRRVLGAAARIMSGL